MHTPVLLQLAVDGLNVRPNGRYVDATLGEGGHLNEILKRGGRVLGIDWDDQQIENIRLKIKDGDRTILVQGNFKDIEKIAKDHGFFPVDGVLFDLGLSLGQIQSSGKGFSYKNLEDPLDMRINSKIETKASDIINNFDQNRLYEILVRNAEEINSRAIVETTLSARAVKRIEKVKDLIFVIDRALKRKDVRTYARVFQALRIEVNQELKNLMKGLDGALHILKNKGRLVVISFHSLEDRIVKRFIKEKKLMLLKKIVGKNEGRFGFEKSAVLRIVEI